MINLGVFFGGRSAEHDVSIITGTQLIENADRSKYNIFPVYIDREGKWFTGEELKDARFFLKPDFTKKGIKEVSFSPETGVNELVTKGVFGQKTVAKLDAAIIAMHGMHGEDGTLQGLFELSDLPYQSCGVTGSSASMDKVITKAICKGIDVPCLDGLFYERDEAEKKQAAVMDEIEAKIGYPVIVKPANLGSSIGIKKAHDRKELGEALELACSYDRRILVEHAIDNLKEINCAVLGLGGDAETSLLEQPLSKGEILDFADKYLSNASGSKGMKSLDRILPAVLPKDQEKIIKESALKVFKYMDMKGVVRIDFMIDMDNGKVYLNEINTIPGSFAFYLFEPAGLKYKQMIDRLVDIAFRRLEEKKRSNFAYDSSILQKVGKGSLKTGRVK